MFWEADKPQIAIRIADLSRKVSAEAIKTNPKPDPYVLDGGSLLYRLRKREKHLWYNRSVILCGLHCHPSLPIVDWQCSL